MKRIKVFITILLGSITGVLAYGYFLEPNLVQVKKVIIHSDKLSEVFKSYKVVQLSDLQMSSLGKRERKVLNMLENINPDIVFLTGDYIADGARFEPVLEFLEQLPARVGVWGVLGNSDYSNEAGSCILCHEANSKVLKKTNRVKFLRNKAEVIEIPSALESIRADGIRDKKRISIIGLDDPVTGRADLNQSLQNVSTSFPKILLSHSPDIFAEAVRKGIDLVLAGHNHGGQFFFISFLKKIINALIEGHNLQYIKGIYSAQKTIMYVNSGIGTSEIPLRIGVRPEVTVFEFIPELN